MNNFIDIAHITGTRINSNSCLESYMNVKENQTKSRLSAAEATTDLQVFKESVLNLTSQLEEFLEGAERRKSFLALGQVQSGKTAHLLASVAWAADSRISTAAILTGVTNPLNEQTIGRVARDLVGLGDHFVKIFRVPTNPKGNDFKSLMSDVRSHVKWRLESGNIGLSPLPIFVLIKKKARIDTLAEIYNRLEREFGISITHMLIDDEADQATPNAGAFRREVAQTYEALSNALQGESRRILLSYTATPQAVLLSEKLGNLQPDQCVLVPPRKGYFGLEQVVSSEFEKNRILVHDWNTQARNLRSRPRSLEMALIDFFVISWIRFNRPRIFYKNSLATDDLSNRLKSTQMLIHESSRQVRHTKMYEFVEDFRKVFAQQLREILSKHSIDVDDRLNALGIRESLDRISRTIDVDTDLFKNVATISELFSLVNGCCIKVVNASSDRPNRHMELPTEDSDWENFRTWILIGGDILGRGLTIPQLVSTYFLRSSQTPNFDTVAQQMRFCGYRSEYAQSTYLYATQDTFLSFEYMNMINSVVWNSAHAWDQNRVNLKKNRPQIMYASSTKINMEACRRSVRDPDLQDIRINGETVVSAKDIYRPSFVKANRKVIRSWIDNTRSQHGALDDWEIFKNVDSLELQQLIGDWNASNSELPRFRAAREIFNHELGELGLGQTNISIAVRSNLIDSELADVSSLENFLNSIEVIRTVRAPADLKGLKEWKKSMLSKEIDSMNWPKLQTHIGDEQRNLRASISTLSTLLILEPIIGTRERYKRNSGICAGIALTLLAPKEFEVQLLGHQ